jgi:predicted dehydrogenase
MGRHHGTSMKNVGGLEPIAACDMEPARLKVAADEFPGIKTYSKAEDMLADSRVQGVVVILPHNLHAPMALKALGAGKHVIVEKPFCLTESEADSMIGAARENEVSLVVYQNRRWDHNYLTAKKLVESGAIGKVFETQIDFGGYGNPGTWWRSDKKTSGGPLYDWGAHCIDWMLNIVGSKVVGVSGYFQKRVWHMVTNEDHCRVVIRFEGGEVANFCNSSLYAATKPGWIILGTTGGINFPTVFDKEATLTTVVDGRLQKAQVACEADDWDGFYRNLADHLQNGVPLICRPEQSARVIGIVETAEKSAAQGRELPFADKYFGK